MLIILVFMCRLFRFEIKNEKKTKKVNSIKNNLT